MGVNFSCMSVVHRHGAGRHAAPPVRPVDVSIVDELPDLSTLTAKDQKLRADMFAFVSRTIHEVGSSVFLFCRRLPAICDSTVVSVGRLITAGRLWCRWSLADRSHSICLAQELATTAWSAARLRTPLTQLRTALADVGRA